MRVNLTPKQIEILKNVVTGNGDGTPCSLKELHQAATYSCTEQAIQCSVNFLVRRGLVNKSKQNVIRNGRCYTVVTITSLGQQYLKPYMPSLKDVLVEQEEDLI